MADQRQIVVARKLLSEDEEKRYERLSDYFCDRTVACSVVDDGWLLTLGWQDKPERYKDPNILTGLHWWSPRLSISEVPTAVRQESGFQLALNDCWSLVAWSRWISDQAAQQDLPNELVLLHVDDHDDLMSPRIVRNERRWVDAITGEEFSLLDVSSVASAIESGAVGIGSFIVPLLYEVPRVHIRHLCVTEYSTSRPDFYRVELGGARDDLLVPGANRQSATLQRNSAGASPSGHSYRVASNPREWLAALPDAPVLLHLDLDFFNNRFNGDSDWRNRPARHDPPLADILASVDAIFAALRAEGILPKIADMTVALSPRFFPSEFWEPTIDRIRDHARGLYDRAGTREYRSVGEKTREAPGGSFG